MKKLTLFSILVYVNLTGFGQQEIQDFSFKETVHDFGQIKELDGPISFKFDFINTGQKPVIIQGVRASCGCTTPDWSRNEVVPGDSGFVTAEYHPLNRPGPFNKSLTVTTNGTPSTIVLRIRGQVMPKPRTIEDDFPTVLGALRIKYRALNMGRVKNNEPAVKSFQVYNQSQKTINFQSKVEAPDYIHLAFDPSSLGSEEKGNLIVTYDVEKRHDLGFMSDNLVFYTNENGEDARKSLSVYADVQQYFPPMTPEQMAQAPHLSIEKKIVDFGKMKQGEVKATDFVLVNEGQSDLKIVKTKSSCSCTVARLATTTLKPGDRALLNVTFNSTGRRGNQQKSVTIYTNDPKAPVQRVTLKAVIDISVVNN